jgi:HEPN domain-containing protein
MVNRYPDWLEQARRNLEHAEGSITLGHFAWACFAAQQAAEAAANALHLRFGQFARGHSVTDLLAELPEDVRPEDRVLDSARVLDKYYIPTRYPDAHPSGSAGRNYTLGEAEAAVRLSREIVEYGERTSLEAR